MRKLGEKKGTYMIVPDERVHPKAMIGGHDASRQRKRTPEKEERRERASERNQREYKGEVLNNDARH